MFISPARGDQNHAYQGAVRPSVRFPCSLSECSSRKVPVESWQSGKASER